MPPLHSLLARQLKRHNLPRESIPPAWVPLFDAIDDAYRQFDNDRGMLERSLELSSQELLQANLELRALFQAIPDFLLRLDREGRIIDCRGGRDGSFPFDRKELAGKRFEELPARGLARRFADTLALAHRTSTVLSSEYSLETPQGERFFEARLIPLRDGQTIAIVRDITQRTRAAEELYHSKQMLELVLDNIPQRVFWKDRRSRYLGCNRPFAKDVDLRRPEEIVGLDDFDISWARNAELYVADDQHVMASGVSKLNFEEQRGRQDGSQFWIRTSKVPLRDQQGQVIGVLGTFEDITEQRRAHEALHESEERYRIVAETTGQLVYDWDVGSGAVRWAGAIENLTGYTPEELGRADRDAWTGMIHEDDRRRVLGTIEEAIASGHGYRVEYRVSRKDGTTLHAEDTGAFIRDESGGVVRGLGAMKDISERVRAEEEKKRAEEQLRQASKMEAIGRLAGGVAHDFNNILTGILGYTEILIDSVPASDPMLVELSEIHRAAKRAASLTAQLLAFSRKQIIDPKVFSLGELVAGSSKMLARLIGEDIALVFLQGPGPDNVKADPGQVEQILVNLAVNARDAMPRGGRLTIESSVLSIDEAFCALHPDAAPGSYVLLSVTDTGSGMAGETLEHLFEPFFTTKERGKGTGLGLSTVYGIVRQNGGFVAVDSQLEHGTTFRIYLPRVLSETEGVAVAAAGALPPGSETVLLVEDEEVVRKLARQILDRQGYRVMVAANGNEALDLAARAEGPIDLLLTDVVMPRMSGKQLFEKLRAERPALKVLFMSGYTEETVADMGLPERKEFLQKPFTLEVLIRRVRQILDGERGG